MAASFTTESNAADVATRLLKAADDLGALDSVNDAAGRIVEAAARPPVVTGALAASLSVTATDTTAQVVSGLRYATFVHWGAPRKHVRAQPFLLAALQVSREDILALYIDHAQRVVSDI